MKTIALLIALTLPLAAAPLSKKGQEAVPNVTIDQVTFGAVVNDKPFDAASLKGKVVVVDLWGVNCGPCVALLPEMAKIAHSGESKGLVVIGIEAQNSPKEAILPLLKKARVEYPVTAGGNAKIDNGGIPRAGVWGADGKLVWVGHPGDESFKRAISKALHDAKAEAAPASKL
jgi:thiol-disulfide isomerase/thioredoxin